MSTDRKHPVIPDNLIDAMCATLWNPTNSATVRQWVDLLECHKDEDRIAMRAALSVLARNVSDEMVAAGSFVLPPPDEFGFWKTEDFRRAIAAALSAAGDEDRRA